MKFIFRDMWTTESPAPTQLKWVFTNIRKNNNRTNLLKFALILEAANNDGVDFISTNTSFLNK